MQDHSTTISEQGQAELCALQCIIKQAAVISISNEAKGFSFNFWNFFIFRIFGHAYTLFLHTNLNRLEFTSNAALNRFVIKLPFYLLMHYIDANSAVPLSDVPCLSLTWISINKNEKIYLLNSTYQFFRVIYFVFKKTHQMYAHFW